MTAPPTASRIATTVRTVRWRWETPVLQAPVPDLVVGTVLRGHNRAELRIRPDSAQLTQQLRDGVQTYTVGVGGPKVKRDGTASYALGTRVWKGTTDGMPDWLLELIGADLRVTVRVDTD